MKTNKRALRRKQIERIKKWYVRLYRAKHTRWILEDMKDIHSGKVFSVSNPPSWFSRKWRREARARQREALVSCKDFDNLQIPSKNKITSIYDWY